MLSGGNNLIPGVILAPNWALFIQTTAITVTLQVRGSMRPLHSELKQCTMVTVVIWGVVPGVGSDQCLSLLIRAALQVPISQNDHHTDLLTQKLDPPIWVQGVIVLGQPAGINPDPTRYNAAHCALCWATM